MLKPVPTIENASTDQHRWISCPMCGFEFERTDTRCEHGCPLGAYCNLVSCPNCDYEFPDRPQRTSWLWRLLRRKEPDPPLPEGIMPASQMLPGTTAEVVCLGAGQLDGSGALSVYGLEPGAEIELIQQRPSCVIRIDETELAMDREIAEGILVKSL